jgi:hypothetical protein
MLDTATASRLESQLDWPVIHPSQIPEDLLERIPGMDPDCLARLRALPDSLPRKLSRPLGASCADIIQPYLREPLATDGNIAASSSSRLEDSPAWQRSLRGYQRIGPASVRLAWSPDRPSPWSMRRIEWAGKAWSLTAGDLPGWSEAPSLWNRPVKPTPSPSFLQGGGASLNGIEGSARSKETHVKFAGHRRDGVTAGIAGIGAFGQFLSISGGSDPVGAWSGIAVQSSADFDGIQARIHPSLSRRDTLWNSSMGMDVHSPASGLAWRSWILWDRHRFDLPLATRPSATGPLKPLANSDWSSGGISFDRAQDDLQWHASVIASGRGDGAACALPSASASLLGDERTWQAELKWWWLFPDQSPPRQGGSSRQSVEWNLGPWTPSLRLEEERDTVQWRIASTPALAWKPLSSWESRVRIRQFLTELTRRELALATVLHPVRGTSLLTEFVCRQGSLTTESDRWYFRLEASSLW